MLRRRMLNRLQRFAVHEVCPLRVPGSSRCFNKLVGPPKRDSGKLSAILVHTHVFLLGAVNVDDSCWEAET